MNTFLNQEIAPTTLAILYLCEYKYNPPSIIVAREIQFNDPHAALNAYANIPNPESQLASGNTQEELFKELEQLHKNLTDPAWVDYLGNCL